MEGSVLLASCECGETVRWDTAKSFTEAGHCSCGLSVPESIVHGPHREQALRLAPPRPTRTDDSSNVVYFARTWEGLIKIGTSCDVWRRVSALQAELLGVIPGGYAVERATHHRFREHLERGREWFRPHEELMAYIDEHCTMPDPPAPVYNPTPVDGWLLAKKTRADIY